MRLPIHGEHADLTAEFTIGRAKRGEDTDPKVAIACADEALYAAKWNARNDSFLDVRDAGSITRSPPPPPRRPADASSPPEPEDDPDEPCLVGANRRSNGRLERANRGQMRCRARVGDSEWLIQSGVGGSSSKFVGVFLRPLLGNSNATA